MIYNPTGIGEIELDTIVLDLNGTIALHGKIVPGVKERLTKLKDLGFTIYLFSGDQRGNVAELAQKLGIDFKKASTAEEKEKLMLDLDKGKTVAIGNARIDIGTFKQAKLRIGTLQTEGIHVAILEHLDILVPSINDALDLLLDVSAFNATMRK